jgi:hypothetical protein
MTRSAWGLLTTLTVVVLLLSACRSGSPPNAGVPGVVGQRAGGTSELVDKVIIDPACSDFATEQNQVVCIANNSTAKVDLNGWLIRNTLGRTYYFPTGTSIEPGQSLKVHTGAGTNDAQNLYWNYEFKPVFDRNEQIVLVSTDNLDIDTFMTP